MIAIIAEKPSVAREIAHIVGATDKQDGYIQGNGYMVTWAYGHLVGLAMPEEYGYTGFKRENLPIFPSAFILTPRQVRADKGFVADPGALKQLKIIKKVFDNCDRIIVSCDAGREGELIFRYIYNYIDCRKPFDRLWISSLTDKAIREGLQNLKVGTQYDNLFYAAQARSEADWVVGINASQALSISAGRGSFSLGRVQTPTLAMICSHFLENKDFTPSKYWQLKLQTDSFNAISLEKFDTKEVAESNLQRAKSTNEVVVKSVERKEMSQEAPLLYDLTTLQKEANSKLGFSADKTLSIAQKLYEAKLTTYPRTGSRYISEDVFDTIPELVDKLTSHTRFGEYAQRLTTLGKRPVDGKKVTDHHAILITENSVSGLQADDKAIYEMIAGRVLEAFSDKCIKDVTTVVLSCDGVEFGVKGSVIKQDGWRAVFHDKEEGEDNVSLPPLSNRQTLPLGGVELLEKQTKPKPLHTESSLLSAMESAGKELEDEQERAAMKESGIGTPATRAAIIETLLSRDYMCRDKKSLIPTEKGLAVYQIVKDKKIADVQMTGMWENALSKIENGEMDSTTFKKGIEVYAAQITTELLAIQIAFTSNNDCACPKCKSGRMLFYDKVVKCSNVDCSVTIFRNKSDKHLTEKQVTELLTTGKTSVIKGFKSKAGKSFDASLAFDEQYNVTFIFPEKSTKGKRK